MLINPTAPSNGGTLLVQYISRAFPAEALPNMKRRRSTRDCHHASLLFVLFLHFQSTSTSHHSLTTFGDRLPGP